MRKFIFIFLPCILPFYFIDAQNLLTENEAIGIALKNNYDILVSQNDASIAKANNTAGNAGMLPTVGANGTKSYSQNNLNQKLSNGNEIKSPNASTNSFNAGVALNWTLFDGGKMFVTKAKLNEIEKLGEIQYKDKVLRTVYDVTIAYYDVVKEKQQLLSISEAISYNKEQVKILQTSFNAGLSPKTSLLQAQIDLNVYQEEVINQQFVIDAAKRNLNQLLSRETNFDFDVQDSIPLNYTPDKTQLKQRLDSTNTGILLSQKQLEISRLTLNEFRTLRFPVLDFNAGYNLVQTDNSRGNILRNHSYGPAFGASISIPIFQAGNTSRQIKTAKIQLQSDVYNLEYAKLKVNTDFQNAITEFENQQKLLDIEKKNANLAKENLEISIQRLRLGQTTTLEVRQAQESFVSSVTRLINFKYNLKVSETKLKQLLAQF